MATAWKSHVLVLGLYIVLTLGMTWPVIAALETRVAGEGGDAWQTMWRFEEKSRALSAASNEMRLSGYIRQEFLGAGEARLVNLSVWPWMGLHYLFGQPAGYNVTVLMSFGLTGYAMYLLCLVLWRDFGKQLVAPSPFLIQACAFLAGAYVMFLPYHTAHSFGHFGAMQVMWPIFIVLAFWRYTRTGAIRDALVLGVLCVVQSWVEHHYVLWLGVFLAVVVLKYFREVRTFFLVRAHRVSLGFLAAILIVGILPLWPTLRLTGSGDSAFSLGQAQTVRFSADLFAVVVPASFHPIWGDFFDGLFGRYISGNVAESTHYLGILPLLLLLFFHQRIPLSQKKFWLLIAAVFFVISLGPRLQVFGRVLPVPLPYALIDDWPLFSAVRTVARAQVLVGISAAALLFWVFATQFRRSYSVGLALGFILLEFLFWPFPTQSAHLSDAYALVRDLPGRTVLEIPAGTNYTAASRALYAEHIHGKDTLGNIALERAMSAGDFDLVKSAPVIRQLLYLRTTDLRQDRVEFFSQKLPETFFDTTDFFDVAAIIIHTDSVSVLQLSALRGFLEDDVGLVPDEFEDVLVYVPHLDTPTISDGIFLMRDGAWRHVGYDPKRESVFAQVHGQAGVTLVNTSLLPRQARLTFGMAPESKGSGEVRDAQSRVIASFGVGEEQVSFTVDLAPGRNEFTFLAPGDEPIIIQNPILEGV